jgi:hypothetical protein
MYDRVNDAAFTISLGKRSRNRKTATSALKARVTSGLNYAFSAGVRGESILWGRCPTLQ